MIENKKSSILLVLKVLEEYSDKDHFLTQKDILEKINLLYGMSLERKSIGSSINLLEELDYDIVRSPSGGVALLSRTFDDSEVKFLIDAVMSSKSISGKQANDICSKLSNSLSVHERKEYDYLHKSTELTRTNNKQVFYNIEIISEAIKKNKWIGFKYLTYDDDGKQVERFDGYVYHASPCYLVNNYGKYYLLAYRPKHDSVITWRVDNMTDVEIFDERERINPRDLKEFKDYSSINEYLNTHIYLFGGEVITAVVELKEASSLSYIKEYFGNKAIIYKDDKTNKLRARIKCNEMAFFYWIMQYGEHMKVISPQSMIDKIKIEAEKLIDEYK